MRIEKLEITNFRGIERLEMQQLKDCVVIAGQNGAGKSCIFDAIRLLKSYYGMYFTGELNSWFNEFGIDFQRNPAKTSMILRDKGQPATIRCEFSFSASEKTYIKEHASPYYNPNIISSAIATQSSGGYATSGSSSFILSAQPAAGQKLKVLQHEIELDRVVGELSFNSEWKLVSTKPSPLLEFIFSHYIVPHIGVIDYHSAHRNYSRE
ncbi:MAG: AAA family ATPase, partial [Alphaproteobacteria bacterium]|nr:AAA family ATPase [Alphaproteobacteria bacterium]